MALSANEYFILNFFSTKGDCFIVTSDFKGSYGSNIFQNVLSLPNNNPINLTTTTKFRNLQIGLESPMLEGTLYHQPFQSDYQLCHH